MKMGETRKIATPVTQKKKIEGGGGGRRPPRPPSPEKRGVGRGAEGEDEAAEAVST